MLFQIVSLLVNTITGLLGGLLLLRFWMQAIRVRPPNTVGQFTFTLTDWLVLPLRRVIAGVGGYDWASLVGAFLVSLVASLLYLLFGFPLAAVLVIALQNLAQSMIYGLMLLLVVEVIFSWINPMAPAAPFVRALNYPLLRALRRVLPPVGGLDLSCLVALVLLQIASILVNKLFSLI